VAGQVAERFRDADEHASKALLGETSWEDVGGAADMTPTSLGAPQGLSRQMSPEMLVGPHKTIR